MLLRIVARYLFCVFGRRPCSVRLLWGNWMVHFCCQVPYLVVWAIILYFSSALSTSKCMSLFYCVTLHVAITCYNYSYSRFKARMFCECPYPCQALAKQAAAATQTVSRLNTLPLFTATDFNYFASLKPFGSECRSREKMPRLFDVVCVCLYPGKITQTTSNIMQRAFIGRHK